MRPLLSTLYFIFHSLPPFTHVNPLRIWLLLFPPVEFYCVSLLTTPIFLGWFPLWFFSFDSPGIPMQTPPVSPCWLPINFLRSLYLAWFSLCWLFPVYPVDFRLTSAAILSFALLPSDARHPLWTPVTGPNFRPQLRPWHRHGRRSLATAAARLVTHSYSWLLLLQGKCCYSQLFTAATVTVTRRLSQFGQLLTVTHHRNGRSNQAAGCYYVIYSQLLGATRKLHAVICSYFVAATTKCQAITLMLSCYRVNHSCF